MMIKQEEPSGISQFEWDNLLYDAGYGYNSNFNFEFSSFGGGGGGSGSGGGGSGTYSYFVLQWANGTDRQKNPQDHSIGGRVNKFYFENNYSGPQDPSEYALNTFNNDYNFGASRNGDDDFYSEAQRLKDHFIKGSGTKLDLGTGAIAKHIFNSTNFKTSTEKFEKATRDYYDKNKNLDEYDGDYELNLYKPDKFTPFNSELPLTTVMGGYHQITANVTVLNNQLTFTYTIYDVFGAGR